MMLVSELTSPIYLTLFAIVLGYILDMLIGDPHRMWHPIVFIGKMISFFSKRLRKSFPDTDKGAFRAGVWLVILVLFFSALIPLAILVLCFLIHWGLGLAMETYMCYTILATRSLRDESVKVQKALEEGGLDAGRHAVSMIVGRDTENLSEEGVIKATVETVAENTSDGSIAPLFYMMIGGPVLGYFYKAVNTMDSMVGYKNDEFMFFGRAAAKFDDFMNYIPSRLSAWIMIFATRFCGMDTKNAKKIFRRDRRNHASPNSAQTESVMAGALDVQLAGDATYFGKTFKKPTIGDPIRPIEAADIGRACKLLFAAAAVSLVLFSIVRLAVTLCVTFI